jgi:hypothetical protein
MAARFSIYLIVCCLLAGCSPKKLYGDSPAADRSIVRFDTLLFRFLTANPSPEPLLAHRPFLDLYGEKILGIGTSDSAGFFDRLAHYFSDSTLLQLYRDEQSRFDDLSTLDAELIAAFDRLARHFPDLRLPEIYLHVSGWGLNVVVTDDLLSLSADKYLGEDYPLYINYFYEYQRQNMTPRRMAPDYLLGFLMANFPFRGNDDLLLDRLIYEGALRYILSQVLPERPVHEWFAYTPSQYEWCEKHCDRIWKSILDRRQLFHPDRSTTDAFFVDSPSTSALPTDSPPRTGAWLGYRIVASYFDRFPHTPWYQLFEVTDYSLFLKESHFNPRP